MTDDTLPPDEPEIPRALPDGIEAIAIEEELKSSYLDYAMSVIVARALPDVRDGLKPVHRRILYTMEENGLTSDKAYRKCATVVGDVMGRYHPHGDGAVYDALVRLAQPWSMGVTLIDGQGNFGSIDGDPPAAYRYTECKLEKVASPPARRHRQGHGRFQRQLRHDAPGAGGSAGAVPEPARQWRGRHRRRHGNQYSAAQSGRNLRRDAGADRQSGD